MRKVCNIDSAEVFARTNVFYQGKYTRANDKWITVAFTEPQLNFLNEFGYALRLHPKHSPTIEVFVDDQNMTLADWTMLRLIF
jgi:hypothetical protein